MESMPRPPAWKVWLFVVPLALAAGLWGIPLLLHPVKAGDEEKKEAAEAVKLTPADLLVVTARISPELVQASGTLEPLPDGRATVGAEVAGRLVDLNLKPGDTVQAG